MKKSGYTALELMILILVLGAITLFVASLIGKSLKVDNSQLVKSDELLILTCAKKYGREKIDNLKTGENILTISINDLIESGCISPSNDEGDYLDPKNPNHKLNDVNIKLTYDESADEIKATIME